MILTETLMSNLTWQEKQNKVKKFEGDVISKNCDVIAIFSIYDQFEAISKPVSGCIVRKLIFLLIVTFILLKIRKEVKNH